MFKTKAKKNGMGIIKNSLAFGSGVIAERMSHGMKHAGDQMSYIGDYVRKNPNISMIGNRLQKNPTGSALAIAGIGLAVLGILALMRKS